MIGHQSVSARDDLKAHIEFLKQNPQLADVPFEDWPREMPMHRAAYLGNLDDIDTLIDLGSKALTAVDHYGLTPLHYAARGNQVGAVDKLVRLGCGVDVAPRRTTPLSVAAENGHVLVIEALVRLGSKALDTPDETLWTPMYGAAREGRPKVIEALVRLGSKGIDALNHYCKTAYQTAVERERWDSVKVLKALRFNPTSPIIGRDRVITLTEEEVMEVRWRVHFADSLLHRLLFYTDPYFKAS